MIIQNNFWGKFLAGVVGIFWTFVIFKAFKIGYMKGVSWFMVWSPFLVFILTSFAYIILGAVYVKWIRKPEERKMSAAELKLFNQVDQRNKRRYHQLMKPTRIKDGAAKAFMAVIALIIALMIWVAIKPDPNAKPATKPQPTNVQPQIDPGPIYIPGVGLI